MHRFLGSDVHNERENGAFIPEMNNVQLMPQLSTLGFCLCGLKPIQTRLLDILGLELAQ